MTRTGRLLAGVLSGALLACSVFPESRALLVAGLSLGPSPAISAAPLVFEGRPLPAPSTPEARGQWVEVGARRLVLRDRLKASELDSLISVVKSADDGENAFWPAMLSVFCQARGLVREADQAWAEAAVRRVWVSPQFSAIQLTRERLREESGESMGWHDAVLASLRSEACERSLEMRAREISRTASLTDRTGLERRRQSLLLGTLIRDHSRSLAAGEVGLGIAEISSFPGDVAPISSPRKLLIARANFIEALIKAGWETKAQMADAAFRGSDGWWALSGTNSGEDELRSLTAMAMVLEATPGVLLYLGLIFGLGWGLARLLGRTGVPEMLLRPACIIPIAVGLAFASFFFTQLPLAALAVGGSFGLLAVSPKGERTRAQVEFGQRMRFALGILALLMATSLWAFVLGVTRVGWECAAALALPSEYFGGSSIPLGLTAVFLGLALLLAPAWALTRRFATHRVASLVVERLFQSGFLIAMGILVVGLLPALAADRWVKSELRELLTNEPLHRISQ